LTKPEHNKPDAGLSLKELSGVLLPITTPFQTDGAVDGGRLRENIRSWKNTGIVGYVVLGSTGERAHLDEKECLDVIVTAREEVAIANDGFAFIVGAGQQSTRATINEINRVSAAVAVDAFLVITPYYYKSAITQDALYKFYMAVADAAHVPLILYSMPALTGISLAPETVARLSEHANIIGLKDSSNDMANLADTIRLVKNDFAVLTGNGPSLYAALKAGAIGGILAVGCVAPKLCVAIYKAVASGDDETAKELQDKLTPLANAVTMKYGIGGLKAAVGMIGLYGGSVRAPLEDASEDARQDIARLLEAAGVIGDNDPVIDKVL